MSTTVFGRWGDTIRDAESSVPSGAVPDDRHFPPAGSFPQDTAAIMSGKGFLVFDENIDFFSMLHEYVRQVQEQFACGKCLPGIKGTKLLLVTMDKIAGGEGQQSDLALLERIADILDGSTRCSVCQSAGELTRDGLTHFREHFERALTSGATRERPRYYARLSAPCMTACPCHINVPGYVEMLQEVRYDDALAVIREEMPLPGITGRVCPAPCEKACTLANLGGRPIPIRVLKRVAADYEMQHKLPPPLTKRDLPLDPVAVVGAGPAGVSAAFYLNRLGHPVTIFESLPLKGGMAAVGIPPYRQPREVLTRDIDIVLGLGVELESDKKLGRDFSIQDLLDRGYKAVFLGIGSHRSIPLGIPGESEGYNGVMKGGIDFLRDLNLGKNVRVGDRVIIVGGGNTAIDCARTCLRMGASEVHVVYRRTRNEMPADEIEIEDAAEEGVQFHYLTQPIEVLAEDGKLTALRCIKMELGESDSSGRRRPVPVEGSEFEMPASTLIPAIGQRSNLDFVKEADGLEVTRWGTLKVDESTMMTSRPGVFAAGDAVTGPLTVVHGVAGGKRAAASMHEHITTGMCLPSDELLMEQIVTAVEKDLQARVTPRTDTHADKEMPHKKLDMRERITSFAEVETGLSQYGSFIESSRCLRCFHLIMAAVREPDEDIFSQA